MASRLSAAWRLSVQGMVCSTQASSACRREVAVAEALQDMFAIRLILYELIL